MKKERAVNDRFAPGVYRGVRELPGGEPVLEMRRLDAADTLEAKVLRGEATAADLDAVLDHLLPLFADSERTPKWGDPAVIRRNLVENLDVLDEAERRFGCDFLAERLRPMQLTALTLLEPVLADRAAAGFVREGHGDLRTEHVYLTDDGVKVLDGIAWSDRLRCVDVADEFAFLAAELDATAADDLSGGLLARYRRRSGDPIPEVLLDFYRSYRHAVRAKVAALDAEGVSGVAKTRALNRAAKRADLAWNAIIDLEQVPLLVAFGGRSGSGKSTLAAAVAERLGATHVRTDVVRKKALDLRPEEPAPASAYTPEARAVVFEAFASEVSRELEEGGSAVADATFLVRSERAEIAEVARDFHGLLLFVWCACDEAVAEARLAARAAEGTDASDADVGVRRRQAVGLGGGGGEAFAEFPHVLRLDTDAPVADLCDRVIDALRVAAGMGRQ